MRQAPSFHDESDALKAFAGLKALLVFVAETYVGLPDGLGDRTLGIDPERIRTPADRQVLAQGLLRILIGRALTKASVITDDNPYSLCAVWQPDPEVKKMRAIDKHRVAEIVDMFIYDGIVGITERLPDVVIRARQAIELALVDRFAAHKETGHAASE